MIRFLATAAIAGALVACGEPRTPHIRSAEDVPAQPEATWRLGADAFRPIGTVFGSDSFALHWPRRPLLIGDGHIAVATDNRRIRIFTETGEYVRVIGGRGEGPGEFTQLQAYGVLASGEFIVIDAGRLVLLDSTGTELERQRIVVRREVNTPPAFTPDGEIIVLGGFSPAANERSSGNEPVVNRDTVDVTVFDMHHEPRVIARVAGMPWWGNRRRGYIGLPLGPRPSIASFNGLVAISEGDRYEVRFVRLDGSQQHLLRLAEPPQPGEKEYLDRFLVERRRSLVEDLGQPRSAPLFPAGFHPTVPETMPAYWRLLFDDMGCLWAQRYEIPGSETVVWDVIDPVGTLKAKVTVPANLDISQITGNIVLGLQEDELGVNQIVGYELADAPNRRPCGEPSGRVSKSQASVNSR